MIKRFTAAFVFFLSLSFTAHAQVSVIDYAASKITARNWIAIPHESTIDSVIANAQNCGSSPTSGNHIGQGCFSRSTCTDDSNETRVERNGGSKCPCRSSDFNLRYNLRRHGVTGRLGSDISASSRIDAGLA